MSRPKLLFLSQKLPFPPDGGGKIRTFHTLRELAREFDITALCFARWKRQHESRDLEGAVKELSRFAKVSAIEIPQSQSRIRFLLDHGRSVFSSQVYTRQVFRSLNYRNELLQLLDSENFDLVHADSLDLSVYFHMLQDQPLVCVHHDVQSRLLARRSEHETSLLKRWYASRQARAMRREEREWCPQLALNVVVSPEDLAAFREIAPQGHYEVFPNGVDIDYFQPSNGSGGGIVFVGGTSWFPNLDAWHYFGREILPLVRAGKTEPSATWVGRSTSQQRTESTQKYGITMTGYVPDVRPYVQKADCVVVPIRVGGGTRIKILDAWAMGKPIVSTSVGCEGLDARDGENLLVRDDPREFADAITHLMSDPGLARRLGQNGRETVVKQYSWQSIGDQMRHRYHALLSGQLTA